jgi:broad specificity phosphatase PhoE
VVLHKNIDCLLYIDGPWLLSVAAKRTRDCVPAHDDAIAIPELPKASKEERSMTSVFFVTHPEVVVDPLIPVPQWKLSPRGIGRVRRMLEQAWVQDIGHIVTSEERKALDTAELLAAHLALSYDTRAELGENDRSATGYLPREEFEATADLFFKHPDRSAKGWEPARAAHARIVGAIDGILEAAPPVNMAVIAHGAVGALLLCHLKGVPISRAEDQPGEGGGNFFVFRRDDRALLQGWRPIDVAPTRIV